MSWMLILLSAWAVVATLLALLIGRSVQLADHKEAAPASTVPDFMPEDWTAFPAGNR